MRTSLAVLALVASAVGPGCGRTLLGPPDGAGPLDAGDGQDAGLTPGEDATGPGTDTGPSHDTGSFDAGSDTGPDATADVGPDTGPAPAPRCDDGERNGGEADVDCGGPCDSLCPVGAGCGAAGDCTTAHCADGRCTPLGACSELLQREPGTPDGRYVLDVDGPGPRRALTLECDMTTAGGGWTLIGPCDALDGLGATMIAVEAAPGSGIDGECRPWTLDGEGAHTYHLTFELPAGFREFRLPGYSARARGADEGNTADIRPGTFVQTEWSAAYGEFAGDVSFGDADARGPVTSFAAVMDQDFDCFDCVLPWPRPQRAYELDRRATRFRLGWGEEGPQLEGWIPWWQGRIALR